MSSDLKFLRDEDQMTKIYKFKPFNGSSIIVVLYSCDEHDFRFKKGYSRVLQKDGKTTFVDKNPDNLVIWGDEQYMKEIVEKFE